MQKENRENKAGHITRGDVFDDLGLSPAEALEAKVKADIWQALIQHIEKKKFSQSDLVHVLKAHQPDVSNLLKGKISKVSITKLIQFAGRLDLNARVEVTSQRAAKSVSVSNTKSTKGGRSLVNV